VDNFSIKDMLESLVITNFIIDYLGVILIMSSIIFWCVGRPLDKNKYDRKRLSNLLQSDKWHSRYKIMISWMLNFFDWLIGRRFVFKKERRNWMDLWINFKRHCLIASFYPLAFFLISWVLGGPKGIGQLSLVPDESKWWVRALFSLSLAVFVYVEWWLLRDSEKASERSMRLLKRLLKGVYSKNHLATERVVVIIFAVLASAMIFLFYILFFANSLWLSLAFTVASFLSITYVGISIGPERDRGAIANVFAVATAIMFATVFIGIIIDGMGGVFASGIISVLAFVSGGASMAMVAITGVNTLAIVSADAIAVALALMILIVIVKFNAKTVIATIIILIVSIIISNSVAISFLLFFMLFPVINGFFDMLSTWFSRFFFEEIKRDISNENDLTRGRIKAFSFALIDLLFAVLFLFFLTFVFFFVLQGFDFFLETELRADELIRRVFSTREYLWIILMLMSTLIPTIVNFFSILLSFSLFPRGICRKCVSFLDRYRSGSLDRVPLVFYALVLFSISFGMIWVVVDGTLFLFDYCGMSIIEFLQNTAGFAVQLASVIF